MLLSTAIERCQAAKDSRNIPAITETVALYVAIHNNILTDKAAEIASFYLSDYNGITLHELEGRYRLSKIKARMVMNDLRRFSAFVGV